MLKSFDKHFIHVDLWAPRMLWWSYNWNCPFETHRWANYLPIYWIMKCFMSFNHMFGIMTKSKKKHSIHSFHHEVVNVIRVELTNSNTIRHRVKCDWRSDTCLIQSYDRRLIRLHVNWVSHMTLDKLVLFFQVVVFAVVQTFKFRVEICALQILSKQSHRITITLIASLANRKQYRITDSIIIVWILVIRIVLCVHFVAIRRSKYIRVIIRNIIFENDCRSST